MQAQEVQEKFKVAHASEHISDRENVTSTCLLICLSFEVEMSCFIHGLRIAYGTSSYEKTCSYIHLLSPVTFIIFSLHLSIRVKQDIFCLLGFLVYS